MGRLLERHRGRRGERLALAIGARPIHLAVLNALPLLGQVFGLPAARYLQTRDQRKPVACPRGGSEPRRVAPPPPDPVPAGGRIRTFYLLAVAAVSHVTHASGAVGWVSWISDLVPEAIRGTYFGVRTAILGLVGALGMTLASAWADAVRAREGAGDATCTSCWRWW